MLSIWAMVYFTGPFISDDFVNPTTKLLEAGSFGVGSESQGAKALGERTG